MFTILLSILFTTTIFAAPPPTKSTVPWSSLQNDKSLIRFQSTLLNRTLLTFLDDCYPPKLSTAKQVIPCTHYFDAIRQLNSTTFVVQQPSVEQILNESNTNVNFCTEKHIFPTIKYYEIGNPKAQDFSNPISCGYLCLEEKNSDFVPKPICVFLAWMGDQLAHFNNTSLPIAPASSANIAANVVATAKNVAVSHEPAKTIGLEEVSGRPGPSIIQSEANSQDVPTLRKNEKVPANTQVVQASDKDDVPKNIPIIVPKKSSAEQKDIPAVEAVPPAAEAAEAAEAAAPAIPKEDTILPPPVKENEDEAIPTFNAEPHQEEKPLKESAVNQGKHDSLPNEDQPLDNDSEADPIDELNQDDDNDDEADGIELSQQKLPKDPPLANPEENEIDQKSSQEIIDSNYLPNLSNSNHVTDPFLEESGSNFFTYFLIGMLLCIILYVLYHNKSKVLALLLEGRRNDKGRSGRRKHTAAYRKLDSNLEEAITSSASGRTTQIIY